MITVLKFGLVGFGAGLTVALVLTGVTTDHGPTPHEVNVLWPTAQLGLDFAGWSDGNTWDFLRLMLLFFGNGVVYAVVAGVFGGAIELAQRFDSRKPSSRNRQSTPRRG